jgi:hypothetical protein
MAKPILVAAVVVGIGLAIYLIYGLAGNATSPEILQPMPEPESSALQDDFSVIYAYGYHMRNILNTVNNTYTHDMVVDPPVVINLTLSELELSTIWNAAQDNKFFRMKNLTDFCPLYPSSSQCANIIPEKEYRLTITANGQNQTVMLRQNYELNQGQDPDLRRFKNITATINSVLSQREELQDLPKPKGGYL